VQWSRADARTERGRKLADPLLHVESGIRQRLTKPDGRLLLLETELRMRVDPMAQLDEI
jgi:hypothetical protein